MGKKKILSIVLAFALIITAGVMSVGTQDAEAATVGENISFFMTPGETHQLTVNYTLEEDETYNSIEYIQEAGDAATIDTSGLITAQHTGEAVVLARVNYTKDGQELSVDERHYVYVSSIYISWSTGGGPTYIDDTQERAVANSDIEGDTFVLTAKGTSGDIAWSSDDTSVATVEVIQSGRVSTARVTLVGDGEASIRATDGAGNSAYVIVIKGDYECYEDSNESPAQATSSQSDAGAPSVGQSYTISPDGTIGSSVRSSTGVLVAGDQKALPAGTVLAPTNAENTSASFTAAAAAVSRQLSNASVAKVIELNLTGPSGEIHQLDSYVTVTLPRPGGIPVGEGQTISVFRVDPNGKLTRCETTYNDYQIVFKTNHFSTFAFVVENASAAKSGTAPKTGEE